MNQNALPDRVCRRDELLGPPQPGAMAHAYERAERPVSNRLASDVAWPQLVTTVHRQMRSLVGPGHRDVEDLTQAALERVLKALPRFEGRAELATFSYRVCVHVAMDHWRGWRRWARRFQFWTDGDGDQAAPGDTGQTSLELERAQRLHRHLERLSPRKRVVITLCYFEDLPASQAAEILEIPEPTVRSRLRAARLELTALLKEDPLFAADEDGGHDA